MKTTHNDGIENAETLRYYIMQQSKRRDAIGASARLMLTLEHARTAYSFQKAIVAKFKDDPQSCANYLGMLADLIDAKARKTGRAIATPPTDWDSLGYGAHRRKNHLTT